MDRSPKGSAHTKQAISDTRRAQIRQAQKSYHARKKINFESLEARASFLEETTQEMCSVFLNFNDKLLASNNFRYNSELVSLLQRALQRTISLASKAIPDDDSGTSRELDSSIQSPSEALSQSSTAYTIEEDTGTFSQSNPMSPREESLELAPFTIILNPLHELDIPTRHPLAAVMFPSMEHWSEFSRRLRWSLIKLGFTTLLGKSGQMLPLAKSIFRFALQWQAREDILANTCCLMEYQAGGPMMEDGTMLLRPRPFSIKKWSSETNRPVDAAKLKEMLDRFLQDCWFVHEHICGYLASDGTNLQEYLEPVEVEEYLQSQGARFRNDGYVELLANVDTTVPKTGGAEASIGDERQDLMNDVKAPYTTQQSHISPSWLLHPNFESGGYTTNQPSSRPENMFWLEPRALFPADNQPADTAAMTPATMAQSFYTPSGKLYHSCLVGQTQVIDALSQQSVYFGSGTKIPTFVIDSTVRSLVAASVHWTQIP